MTSGTRIDMDKAVSRVLLIGMVVSMALMLTGEAMLITHHGANLSTVLPLKKALAEFAKFRAQGWLSIGILALIITPVARVIMAVIGFTWVKDWKYSLVSVVVLTAMLAGLLLNKS